MNTRFLLLLVVCTYGSVAFGGDATATTLDTKRNAVGQQADWRLFALESSKGKMTAIGFRIGSHFVPADPLLATISIGPGVVVLAKQYGTFYAAAPVRKASWTEVIGKFPNTMLPYPDLWREFTYLRSDAAVVVGKGVIDPTNADMVLVADKVIKTMPRSTPQFKMSSAKGSESYKAETEIRERLKSLLPQYAQSTELMKQIQAKHKEYQERSDRFREMRLDVLAIQEDLLFDETKGGERKTILADGRIAKIKLNKRDYDGRRELAAQKELVVKERHAATAVIAEINQLREKTLKLQKEIRDKVNRLSDDIEKMPDSVKKTLDLDAYEPGPEVLPPRYYYTFLTGKQRRHPMYYFKQEDRAQTVPAPSVDYGALMYAPLHGLDI